MTRLKKMPLKIRRELEKAAELIAKGRENYICNTIGFGWIKTQEAQMIRPDNLNTDIKPWWGITTMGIMSIDEECINARLMGIAIMLTMPEEILNHECTK